MVEFCSQGQMYSLQPLQMAENDYKVVTLIVVMVLPYIWK